MSEFKKTDKQKRAIKTLASAAKHVLLYGGSRSGKTFIACYALIVRASKLKSRHLIVRKHFNHAKRTVWHETMPKVLSIAFPQLRVHWNKSDYYIELPNGSEIWIGGLDDKERTEKILGSEYSTIYFNECSQIDYASSQMALTRLAQKNSLKKKAYYDLNPGAKTHWSYWLFLKHLDPLEDEPLDTPEDYAHIQMNPGDNLENLDEEYLKILERMPEKERQRFLEGIFQDVTDGIVYYAFDREKHVAPVPDYQGTYFIGMDFNYGMMSAVICFYNGDKFYIKDAIFLDDGASDTYRMCDVLKKRGYSGQRIIPDSTGRNRRTSGKSDFVILKENGFILDGVLNPFVTDRVNNVNRLFSEGKIVVDPKAKKLIGDLEKVQWKDNKLDQSGENKKLTHVSDCLGYICWRFDPIITRKSSESIQL